MVWAAAEPAADSAPASARVMSSGLRRGGLTAMGDPELDGATVAHIR